jgi:glycosyltransferase involved in cell wall biosynthesis
MIENGAHPDVLLVVAGPEGWHTREVVGRVNEMKGRVHRTGYVDEQDLAALYSAAMGFVYASHYEGFGLPLLEAMQCGLPVIYGDNSAMPEVVGGAGLGVKSTDAHDIAEKMQRLLGDAALRDELSEQALARSARFTWEAAANSTLDVYRKLLGCTVESRVASLRPLEDPTSASRSEISW